MFPNVLLKRSTLPLPIGWYGVVRDFLTPATFNNSLIRISSLADDTPLAVADIFFNVPVYMRPEEPLAGQAQTPELPLMTGTVVDAL
ncbi:hypothetical protein DPEC_G00100060 [Dallia pectoralis]|uniref:Uncharacterized protein n=1 Tax=Dallia pectoralis TaxID=75939 RepID=A0ACC2GXD3_DALPE|nr:hypothetical protein DPEC_G00100060 [Dallia pectoralis]